MVRDVQDCLVSMAELVAPGASSTMSHRATCAALRKHILEITRLLIGSGYSPEMHDADVALTRSIDRYQFGFDDATIGAVRDRLSAYAKAATSGTYTHAPIELLVPSAAALSLLPRSTAGSTRVAFGASA